MRYNRKTVAIVTPPATPTVSTADMKAYLRVDTSDDDSLIASFVDAATESVKQYIKRSLINETLELTMDGFTQGMDADEKLLSLGAGVHTASYPYTIGSPNEVDLQFLPIVSITSVTTFNRSNTSAVFASSNYELDGTGGRLYLNEGVTWPDNLRAREAVKIVYVAGYGSASTDIPSPILQVIKQMVSEMYDCRGLCHMSESCKRMLDPYKLLDRLAA